MRKIGGFFGLELPVHSFSYHSGAIGLNSGRACFYYILQCLRPKKVFLPFYICESVLSVLKYAGVAYEFYTLNNQLEPTGEIALQPEEVFLYVNYFGVKEKVADKLASFHKQQIIMDNTHTFFRKNPSAGWAYNSARKFFGVPDGAYLYAPYPVVPPTAPNTDIRYDHLIKRFQELGQNAYEDYLKAEQEVSCTPKQISSLSESLLSNVPIERVKQRRTENFRFYNHALSKVNLLDLQDEFEFPPLCYPLLLDFKVDLTRWFEKGIYLSSYWKEVSFRSEAKRFPLETSLSSRLLALPIDHRYGEEDCQYVLDKLKMEISL